MLIAVMLCAAILPVSASEESAEGKKDGVLIYEETFDYADELDHNATLTQLGWEAQTQAMGAYTDPTAVVSLQDGKLSVLGAKDTYFLMLNEEDMAAYDGMAITIQYDMEYTTASTQAAISAFLPTMRARNTIRSISATRDPVTIRRIMTAAGRPMMPIMPLPMPMRPRQTVATAVRSP